MIIGFKPYLFDSKSAWEDTVADVRVNYNTPFFEFMRIYNEYKNGKIRDVTQVQETPKEPKPVEVYSEILNQSDIDALLESFMNR